MHPLARHFIRAARCPPTMQPREFGLWSIEHRKHDDPVINRHLLAGGNVQTLLRRHTMATLHNGGEVVMEDSVIELTQHLPIWMSAYGSVLVTGLGLGCVVRGLLASDRVDRVTVVEIDRGIIDAIWPEFEGMREATVVHADALTWSPPAGTTFDFAWHDLWTEGDDHLQTLHVRCLSRYVDFARRQGAWKLPKDIKRHAKRTNARRWLFG